MVKGRSPQFTVLAVASGGGHWEELMLLRPALDQFDPMFATTNGNFARREAIHRICVLPDSNRDHPLKAVRCLWRSIRLVWSVRPTC